MGISSELLFGVSVRFAFLVIVCGAPTVFAQESVEAPKEIRTSAAATQASSTDTAGQIAYVFKLDAKLAKLRSMQQGQGIPGAAITAQELSLRQELLELIQADVLDVDSVLGEISNERNELSDLRTTLESRRDKVVGHLTTAALLTGSGLGTAVNAMQFTTLSSKTQNTGDAIGIGSGVASTVLSIMAAHRQKGPSSSVGETPNMLAPLLDRPSVLKTYYPPAVLRYLAIVPAGEDPGRGTRIEQLRARWAQSGRLVEAPSATREQKIIALTTSANAKVAISISDLADRIAMLGDVQGLVSLMKGELAILMRSYLGKQEGKAHEFQ